MVVFLWDVGRFFCGMWVGGFCGREMWMWDMWRRGEGAVFT